MMLQICREFLKLIVLSHLSDSVRCNRSLYFKQRLCISALVNILGIVIRQFGSLGIHKPNL